MPKHERQARGDGQCSVGSSVQFRAGRPRNGAGHAVLIRVRGARRNQACRRPYQHDSGRIHGRRYLRRQRRSRSAPEDLGGRLGREQPVGHTGRRNSARQRCVPGPVRSSRRRPDRRHWQRAGRQRVRPGRECLAGHVIGRGHSAPKPWEASRGRHHGAERPGEVRPARRTNPHRGRGSVAGTRARWSAVPNHRNRSAQRTGVGDAVDRPDDPGLGHDAGELLRPGGALPAGSRYHPCGRLVLRRGQVQQPPPERARQRLRRLRRRRARDQ